MYWTDCQSSLLPRHVAISRKAKGGCIVQNSKACGINGQVCSEIVQGGAGKRACFCGDAVGGLIKGYYFIRPRRNEWPGRGRRLWCGRYTAGQGRCASDLSVQTNVAIIFVSESASCRHAMQTRFAGAPLGLGGLIGPPRPNPRPNPRPTPRADRWKG